MKQLTQTTTIDAINLVTDLYHLVGTVVSAVNTIQYRIQQIYGDTDYEMAVLLNPARKAYFLNPLPNAPFVYDENFPDDTVFVLCKSVNGERIIKPADDIDWFEYYLRAMAYTKNLSDEAPKLTITKPYLQARIIIKNETTA